MESIQNLGHPEGQKYPKVILEEDGRIWPKRLLGQTQEAFKRMSLQRRRERYCIIRVWKILHKEAPNDINMQFKTLDRHGTKVILPSVNNKTMTYDHYFSVRAAQLWYTLPAEVSLLDSLDPFKAGLGNFLEQYPDNPPVPG